jgi:HK97 family phage portal protein
VNRTLVPFVEPRKRSLDLSNFIPPALLRASRGGAVFAMPHNALQNSSVYSCVKLLVESISSLPVRLVDRATKKEVTNHPVSLLLDTPNEEQDWTEFVEMFTANLLCHGLGVAEKIVERGHVAQLLPMSAIRTTVERKNGNVVYEYSAANRVITLPAELVLSTRLFGHGDDLTGISPLWAAERAIVLAMRQEQMLLDTAADGGVPPLMIQIPPEKLLDRLENDGVSVEQDDKSIQAQIENARTKLALYLPHGYSGTPINSNYQQLQVQESREFAVAEIARIFRVPLFKLGVLSKGDSASGSEQQQLSFYQDTLRPILVRLEKRFEHDLLSAADRGKYQIKFNVRAALRGDIATQTDQYTKLWQIGSITTNEIRELEDRPPFDSPEADLPHYPVNMSTDNIGGADQPTNPNQGGVPSRAALRAAAIPPNAVQRRSLDARLTAARMAKPMFRAAVEKILRKERSTVLKDAKTILGTRSADNLTDRLKQLYGGELRDFVQDTISQPILVLFEQIRSAMEAELDTGFDPGAMQKMIRDYIRIFVRDYTNDSLYRLLDDIDEGGDILAALESRFDGWQNGTPDAASRIDRESDDEPNTLRNVAAKGLYVLAGISSLRWITSGNPCPICDPLDGKTFSAASAPQCPLHAGCECSLTSGN